MTNETIAAISTARGLAGIGVIRISGDDALIIADKVFRAISSKKLVDSKGYTAHYGNLYNGEEKIDEAIATVFVAPKSYTGENVVEFSCHGGNYTTKSTLEVVLNNGARLASSGEFTKRAFLNGKLSLTEAESVMDIINANGFQTAKSALASRDGLLDEKISEISQSLTDITAHLSVWADYPDEDTNEVSISNLNKSLNNVQNKLQNLIDRFHYGKILKEGINTVIIGKPNVGKSTLMNRLSGYEKSIVTSTAGTTRDIIEEQVLVGDIILNLSDTAGIHDTTNEIEKIGVDKAIEKAKSAELILLILDTSSSLTNEDKDIIELLENTPCIAIINKSDLDSNLDTDYIYKHVKNVVKISAKNGYGINDLEKSILEVISLNKFDENESIFFNERQKEAAVLANNSIKEAIDALNLGITYDAITVLIEDALSHLLELSGKNVTQAVVDTIFSKFCVGK